jgi:hypothetical protein
MSDENVPSAAWFQTPERNEAARQLFSVGLRNAGNNRSMIERMMQWSTGPTSRSCSQQQRQQ